MQPVVIDTNVIISAALTEKGHPSQIMELLSVGVLRLYYSAEILSEYSEVLSREKFNFSSQKQKAFLDKIKEIGVEVIVSSSDIPFSDESDRMFYDVAQPCGATLIAGNKRHYPDEPFIVPPVEFLTLT